MPHFFNTRMKLADIIAANHSLILILPRLNIALGFGEKSLQEVCDSHGVPADFMLLLCNLYTFDDYRPTVEELHNVAMDPLVPYLKASHDYYMRERLPHIETHLNHIAASTSPRHGAILKQFYADFRREIAAHFQREEKEDFPKLERLQQGSRGKIAMGKHLERSHTDLVDKLNDLTQIVYKYLTGNDLPEESIELVFDILQLSADIQKHALIEEKILLPWFSQTERSRI